jgi:hypothetical protein
MTSVDGVMSDEGRVMKRRRLGGRWDYLMIVVVVFKKTRKWSEEKGIKDFANERSTRGSQETGSLLTTRVKIPMIQERSIS